MGMIYVVGVSMTLFGRHLDRSLESLAGEALQGALDDAGCQRADIECAFYSGVTGGVLQGQTAIPGQVVLSKIGLEGIPMFNIENACASGSSAFHLAVQQIKAGASDVALALGSEKMNVPDKAAAMAVFEGGWDVARIAENEAMLLHVGDAVVAPAGSESTKPYSRFMKIYASMCRAHMAQYGLTQRQIAAISAKNHQHSVHNPYAQYRRPFTIDEVLAAPPITYPLTLPMCAPLSDGAAAVIVCSEQGLKRMQSNRRRAVQVAASVIRSATVSSRGEFAASGGRRAALAAYEQAGLGPDDIDVAEVHDATAMGEIIVVEKLGFSALGEAGYAAENGDFSLGGRIPVNPSGGLESKGHPIGATGLAQIFELVTQLRGEAGARQVANARHAIQENGGGWMNLEEAAIAVNIFRR